MTHPSDGRLRDSNASSNAAPDGWHSVTPRIVARNARQLVEFVSYVFGASGEFQPTAPSIVQIGDSKIMISEAGDRDASTAFLYVYVVDVGATYARALERGASSIERPSSPAPCKRAVSHHAGATRRAGRSAHRSTAGHHVSGKPCSTM